VVLGLNFYLGSRCGSWAFMWDEDQHNVNACLVLHVYAFNFLADVTSLINMNPACFTIIRTSFQLVFFAHGKSYFSFFLKKISPFAT